MELAPTAVASSFLIKETSHPGELCTTAVGEVTVPLKKLSEVRP